MRGMYFLTPLNQETYTILEDSDRKTTNGDNVIIKKNSSSVLQSLDWADPSTFTGTDDIPYLVGDKYILKMERFMSTYKNNIQPIFFSPSYSWAKYNIRFAPQHAIIPYIILGNANRNMFREKAKSFYMNNIKKAIIIES